MKKTRFVYAAAVAAMLMGTAALGYAQDDRHGNGNKDRQDRPAQAGQGGQHQPDAQGGQQQNRGPQPNPAQAGPQPGQGQRQTHGQDNSPQNRGQQEGQRHQEQQQPTRNEREHPANTGPQNYPSREQRGSWQDHRSDWQQQRASHFDAQHRTWQQRGGYNGYRVPDDRFGRSFGRGHSFRVFGLPYMNEGGYPRFQYGGYWFSMMEPYPEYWGADWDRDDDMYVDYNMGGYYLYDRRFPGRPGVAISISF